MPLFKTVYAPVKQLVAAFSPDSESGFKKVVIVDDTRRGMVIGFLTREFTIDRGAGPEPMVAVYVPTNHLYLGDVMVYPRGQVLFPDLSVEEGIRIFLTGGMALPGAIVARSRRCGCAGGQDAMVMRLISTSGRGRDAGDADVAGAVGAGAGRGAHRPGGEVNIQLPDLNQGDFLGMTGHQILLSGLVVCVLGLLFGLWTYTAVKNLPVHKSMADVSALIYETCKAYLIQQGKFLLILELFIGAVMIAYFWLTGLEPAPHRHRHHLQPDRHRRQLRRGVVRHPHQHAGQLAHRVCQPAGQGVPGLRHPAARRHERRHDADLGRAAVHARHPALHSR